jgi:uncharacterized membrane protein YfcA
MISLPIAATLAAAVLSTSFISGNFGMAGGMILIGILLLLMPLPAAMVLHGLTQMASNGWRAWLWRSHIAWPVVATYAAGAAAAAILFAAAGLMPDKPTTLILLGLMTFAGLGLPGRLAPDIMRPRDAVACGALCTGLQLCAGVSGPIFDVFFVRSRLDRKGIVATKATIQLLGHFLKVLYFGHALLGSAAGVAPAAVVLAVILAVTGTQLSRRVLDAISDAQFRSWSRALIAAIAAIYLAQGLYLFLSAPRAAADPVASAITFSRAV